MKDSLYEKIYAFIAENPGVKAKKIASNVGCTKTEVNQILYSQEHKAEVIRNENYEWFISIGLTAPIAPIKGVYFLTDVDCLPEVTVYKEPIDYANKLQTVNAAMLCMKCVDYVYVELKRHIDTGDFYSEVHNWQSYQKAHDGFVCQVAYYDAEEGIRKRDFTDYLSDYSMLRLLGYHVGEKISESSRKRILMNCLFFNLIERDKVISHIEYLIKHGGKTPNAKKSWENDLKFIKDYNKNILLPAWKLLDTRRSKWRLDDDQLKKAFLKQIMKS